MSCEIYAPNEPRSIAAAAHHRRLGFAWTGAFVTFALILSICTIVLMIGMGSASALPRQLVTFDDGSGDLGLFTLVAVSIVIMLLAACAFNGLTPSYARRRRSRR